MSIAWGGGVEIPIYGIDGNMRDCDFQRTILSIMYFFARPFTRGIVTMLLFAFFIVACSGGGGGGGESAPPSVIPGIPAGVTASALSGTRVDVAWTAVGGATGYNVYRAMAAGVTATAANKVTTTPVTSAAFSNTGLLAATSYFYIVTAFNTAGESMGSVEVKVTTKATPGAPEGVTAAAVGGDKRIDLAWTEVSGASGYNVYRAKTPQVAISAQTMVTVKPLTTATLNDVGLESATQYFYRVTAINAKGESDGSVETTATTASLSWTNTGSMAAARTEHTATLMSNGKVLVTGGFDAAGRGLSSSELYDPTTGVWSKIKAPFFERGGHTATLLPSGKLLVAGGYWDKANPSGSRIGTTEVYDPLADTWSTIGVLSTGRQSHTATLLPNGKVLVAGGHDVNVHMTCELFDPATGKWSPTGALSTGHTFHSATLLGDGRVLVTGGYGSGFRDAISELYEPVTGTWVPTANFVDARVLHSAAVLTNGKVLVTGGRGSTFFHVFFARTELYDPVTSSWVYAGQFRTPRTTHTSTVLASGIVLIAGGYTDGLGYINSSELYDGINNRWADAGALMVARYSHTATLLKNGKVLMTGGNGAAGPLASSELFW